MARQRNTKKNGRSLYKPKNGRKYSKKQMYMMFGGDLNEVSETTPANATANAKVSEGVSEGVPQVDGEGLPAGPVEPVEPVVVDESKEEDKPTSTLSEEEKEKAGISKNPFEAAANSASEEIQNLFGTSNEESNEGEEEESKEGEEEEPLPSAEDAIPTQPLNQSSYDDQELKEENLQLKAELKEKDQMIALLHDKVDSQHVKYETLLEKMAGISGNSSNTPEYGTTSSDNLFGSEPEDTTSQLKPESDGMFESESKSKEDKISELEPVSDEMFESEAKSEEEVPFGSSMKENEGNSLVDESDIKPLEQQTSTPTPTPTPTPISNESVILSDAVNTPNTSGENEVKKNMGGKSKRHRRTVRKSKKQHKYKYRYVY